MNSKDLVTNLLSSVVVFLVALPLCMGIAIASGVPPEAGLLSGIIGGILVGSVSGCPLLVSGPAAGLVVLIWQIVEKFGIQHLGAIILGAGVVQVFCGLVGMGKWFRAVSPTVIYAMLSGIGVLIFGSQFHVMIDDVPASNGLQSLLSIPSALGKSFSFGDNLNHSIAACIGLLTISVLIFWETCRPEKLKMIPSALVAISLSAIVATIFQFDINYVSLPENFFQSLSTVEFSSFNILLTAQGLLMAISIAIVASAESLLSATAVDKLHNGPRTRYNRELIAQGVGNALCGLFGALPITGVIVRSSANIDAGATTRMSTIVHGFWLLLFVALFPTLLTSVPTSALAALLVFIGFKLINFKLLPKLAEKGRDELCIFLLTVCAIVSLDLLTGILIGVGATVLQLVYKLTHLKIRVTASDKNEYVLELEGAATFVSLPQLANELEKIPYSATLHVHFNNLAYIDHACLEQLIQWGDQAQALGGSVLLEWDALHHYTDRLLVGRDAPLNQMFPHQQTASVAIRQVIQ